MNPFAAGSALGTALPGYEPGEVIQGVANRLERDAEVFTADGFYRTGDIVAELGGGY